MSLAEYSEIESSSEVLVASPHRLIQMLFEKCLLQMKMTELSIKKKQLSKKHAAINNIIDIISYLRANLKRTNETKIISDNLTDLYNFVEHKMLMTNLTEDLTHLNKAKYVIAGIKEGWDGIE
jgi:flagellar protein FliS